MNFPIFDGHDEFATQPQHRFSFTANGIPIFYPNEFIGEWAVKSTLPKSGEPQLPPMPVEEEKETKEPICWDLDSVYENISELAEPKQEKLVSDTAEKAYDELFEKFRALAIGKIGKKEIVNGLEKRVIELYRSINKES